MAIKDIPVSTPYLLPDDRVFTAHLCSSVHEGGLLQVEAMQLAGVSVHLSVVLLHKGLANKGWG